MHRGAIHATTTKVSLCGRSLATRKWPSQLGQKGLQFDQSGLGPLASIQSDTVRHPTLLTHTRKLARGIFNLGFPNYVLALRQAITYLDIQMLT